MKILVKAICKGCGKEFDPRNGVGRPTTYCSKQCRRALSNKRYRENKVKKLGMDYYAWRYHNDSAFREKKREYNRKYKDNKVKELGMSYYAWKWRNDSAFREKKREYNRKYNRSLAERRRDKEKEKE